MTQIATPQEKFRSERSRQKLYIFKFSTILFEKHEMCDTLKSFTLMQADSKCKGSNFKGERLTKACFSEYP